jgi:hypothetical protein
LKPGDQVIVVPDPHARRAEQIGVVSHRTPSGQIVVSIRGAQVRFNADGWERVAGQRDRLMQITPEKVVQIERNDLLAELREADWQMLSTEQLRRILTIVRERQR